MSPFAVARADLFEQVGDVGGVKRLHLGPEPVAVLRVERLHDAGDARLAERVARVFAGLGPGQRLVLCLGHSALPVHRATPRD